MKSANQVNISLNHAIRTAAAQNGNAGIGLRHFIFHLHHPKEHGQAERQLCVSASSQKAGFDSRRRWDFGNYYRMRFLICLFQLDSGEFETVATSLPRSSSSSPSFTLEDIKDLYHLRWGLETGFRDLRYTLGLVNLHGKSDSFAEQEIYSNTTAFNFASRVCREAVIRQPTNGAYAYKANFKMAVALCREFIRTSGADADKLLSDIARYTVPIRPGRQHQRNLRAKGFPGFVYRVFA